jgi:hypothetical protein
MSTFSFAGTGGTEANDSGVQTPSKTRALRCLSLERGDSSLKLDIGR